MNLKTHIYLLVGVEKIWRIIDGRPDPDATFSDIGPLGTRKVPMRTGEDHLIFVHVAHQDTERTQLGDHVAKLDSLMGSYKVVLEQEKVIQENSN